MAIVLMIETSWYSLVALALASEEPRNAYLRYKTWLDRVAGSVILTLGLALVIRPIGYDRPPHRMAWQRASDNAMTLDIQVKRLKTANAVLIQHLRLQVPPGAIHTVMGPSGSGKSSLLAAVCGTLADGLQFDGEIALNGRRLDTLPTERRRIGILFQEDLLFAHMTVFENLLFAVPPGPRAERRAKVTQALQDLEMSEFADTDPATLSGGQRARVALMRALLAEPQALLLDEPFSRLDAALRERMRGFVFERVRQRQIPVLLVTHDDADIADAAHLTRL